MNRQSMFLAAIAAAIVAALLCVYYIIPNVYHVLADPPLATHTKHALLFGIIAVVCVLVALINRPKSVAR